MQKKSAHTEVKYLIKGIRRAPVSKDKSSHFWLKLLVIYKQTANCDPLVCFYFKVECATMTNLQSSPLFPAGNNLRADVNLMWVTCITPTDDFQHHSEVKA